MSNPQKPKVILLESSPELRILARDLLTRDGWEVFCEKISTEALKTLAGSKESPFALFISNFRLPKMEGDDILKKVKSISPMTQRMLMVASDQPDLLISAINKAQINACILTPFKEDDLVEQARMCLKQFALAEKRTRLKRITVYQNKQMFKIAVKLKKKEDRYKKDIDKKKKQLLELKSANRKAEKKQKRHEDIRVSVLVDELDIPADQTGFENLFSTISRHVKSSFDKLALQHRLPPAAADLDVIFNSEAPSPDLPQGINDDDLDIILKAALIKTAGSGHPGHEETPSEDTGTSEESHFPDTGEEGHTLDTFYELSVNETQTQAYLKRKKTADAAGPDSTPSLSDLLDWLSVKMVAYGIIEDAAIEKWLSSSSGDKLLVAQGKEPVLPKPGSVVYHFETQYTNPGKIKEDGSIDFRDRGEIPFAQKGSLLAQKKPEKQGTSGISISGAPIQVEEIEAPVFVNGPGTELSEDGCDIFAATDGQPHLDSLGEISISPDLVINNDVDYETGNIDFNGNIIVKGTIKEGFHVKGINLTAKEIEGAIINLTGDLHISDGITDAQISVRGNVYAKFINNSRIEAYGHLFITKEILDSVILLSGCLQNTTGHIIASKVAARQGIEAGNIGTPSSKPVSLKIGIDEHIKAVTQKIDEALEHSKEKTEQIKDEIRSLEDQDQGLYQEISEKAHIQDRAQLEIKGIQSELPALKQSRDMIKLKQASDKIKSLLEKAKAAEKELNRIFELQDNIARQIEPLKRALEKTEEKNKAYVHQKKAVKEFAQKEEAKAFVSVSKTITQDTVIKGPHASTVLSEDKKRCLIQEKDISEDGVSMFEMSFSDLQSV